MIIIDTSNSHFNFKIHIIHRFHSLTFTIYFIYYYLIIIIIIDFFNLDKVFNFEKVFIKIFVIIQNYHRHLNQLNLKNF